MNFSRHQIFGALWEISKIRTNINTTAIFPPNLERLLVWQFSLSFVLGKMNQFWCPSLVKCNLESKSSTDIDHSPKHSFLACMCAKSLQSFLILYNPTDYSLPAPLPWDSPGKNTGVGCHFLFQRIFPNQGWDLDRLHHRRPPARQANNWAQGKPPKAHQ